MGTLTNPLGLLSSGGRIAGNLVINGTLTQEGNVILQDGTGLEYVANAGDEALVDMEVTDQAAAGEEMSYDVKIDGTDIIRFESEADGVGGIQNTVTTVPADLVVEGSTTETDDIVTTDLLVEDGSGNNLVRFDAGASPKVIRFFGFTLEQVGKVTWGANEDMSSRYDSGADSYRIQDEVNSADRLDLDRTTGDLSIEGTLTEGSAL